MKKIKVYSSGFISDDLFEYYLEGLLRSGWPREVINNIRTKGEGTWISNDPERQVATTIKVEIVT